ncbi:MAG: hypothetical protein AB7N61_03205 [Acidimicrobiia bacterium]
MSKDTNDFEGRLADMFDDTAASIKPRSDFGAVLAERSAAPVALPGHGLRASRRMVSVAAAAAVVVGLPALAAAATMSRTEHRVTAADTSVTPTLVSTTVAPTTTTVTTTSSTVASSTSSAPTTEATAAVSTATSEPPRVEPTTTTTKPKPATTVATTKPAPVVGFAILAAEGSWDAFPMRILVKGTAPIGSQVHATTHYGDFDPVVNGDGVWKLKFDIGEVEVGATVSVRLTNDVSGEVLEASLTRPAPKATTFLAQAAYTECNSTPPYNAYWGKGAMGSTVTITSPYGGTQVTIGADGAFHTRVEFPEAPVGEKFWVRISNSAGGAVYELPMTRLAPG